MNLDIGDTRLIIDECKARGVLRNQAAYLLATAWHETNGTMKPVKEAYYLSESKRKAYFHKMYDINGSRPKVARILGNLRPGDGARFPGGGYTQTTGRTNYDKHGKAAGVDLIINPERVLEPEIAVIGLIDGALEGWWTGKKLGKYVNIQKSNFYSARRVVNGTDKAGEIAGYAKAYDQDLIGEGYGEDPEEPHNLAPVPEAKPKVHKSLVSSKELGLGVGGTALVGLQMANDVSDQASKLLGKFDGNLILIGIGCIFVGFMANRLHARWKDER